MFEAETIKSTISSFVAQSFPLAQKRKFTEDVPLLESGIVDSVGILEIVAFLEREFAIQISDDDLLPENFGSIAGIAAFVERKSATVVASEGRPGHEN